MVSSNSSMANLLRTRGGLGIILRTCGGLGAILRTFGGLGVILRTRGGPGVVLRTRGGVHLDLEERGSLHPPLRVAAPHLGHVAVAARHLDTRRKLHLTSRDVWRCRVSPTAACSSCRPDSLLLAAAVLGQNTGAAPPSSATALCSVGPAPALAADWGPGSPPLGSGGAPPHHLTGQGTLVRLLSSPPRRYGTIRPEVRLLGQTAETGGRGGVTGFRGLGERGNFLSARSRHR